MKHKIWIFYNYNLERKLAGLTLGQAKAFVAGLDPKCYLEWVVWTEGWSAWHSLTQVTELRRLELPLKSELPKAPPLPGFKRLKEESVSSQLSQLKAVAEEVDAPIELVVQEFTPRAHTRYPRRLKVVIECQNRKFETYSVDVSVGGVLLEDSLPDWVNGYSTIDIVNEQNGEVAEMNCSIVENQNPEERKRVAFLPLPEELSNRQFELWLKQAV